MKYSSYTLLIRVDANKEIGSGHIMRCLTVAKDAEYYGATVVFVVSERSSLTFVESAGFQAQLISAPLWSWGKEEGRSFAKISLDYNADAVLVDSYAITSDFFSSFKKDASEITLAYIDDLYTFELGEISYPSKREVDVLINYGFAQYDAFYHKAYFGCETQLCLGLSYAPIRREFKASNRRTSEHVARVLVTTGSTNPDCMLEHIAESVKTVLPKAEVDLVVGSLAECRIKDAASINVHYGVTNLSNLMHSADLAVSSAGTTLYELCAVGLPTVAIALVDNQLPNLDGFVKRNLGPGIFERTSQSDIYQAIESLSGDVKRRVDIHQRMTTLIDSMGSVRIVDAIFGYRNLRGFAEKDN